KAARVGRVRAVGGIVEVGSGGIDPQPDEVVVEIEHRDDRARRVVRGDAGEIVVSAAAAAEFQTAGGRAVAAGHAEEDALGAEVVAARPAPGGAGAAGDREPVENAAGTT